MTRPSVNRSTGSLRRNQSGGDAVESLCRRFVADESHPALVARVARSFREGGGEPSRVYATIFSSHELWSDAAFATKTKTPLEVATSVVRALGGTTDGRDLGRELGRMGEPPYLCQAPTGYAEIGPAWVSSGALLARLGQNIARRLVRDVRGGAHSRRPNSPGQP